MNSLVNSVNNAGYWKQDNALQLGEQGFSVDKNQKTTGKTALDSRTFVVNNNPTKVGEDNKALRDEVGRILKDIAGAGEQTGVFGQGLMKDIREKLFCEGTNDAQKATNDVYKPVSVRTVKGLVSKAYSVRAELSYMGEHADELTNLALRLENVRNLSSLGGKTAAVDKLCARLEAALVKAGAALEKAETALANEAAKATGVAGPAFERQIAKAKAQIASAYAAFSADLEKLARKLPSLAQLADQAIAKYVKAGGQKLGDFATLRFHAVAEKLFAPGMTKAAFLEAAGKALPGFVGTEFGDRFEETGLPQPDQSAVEKEQIAFVNRRKVDVDRQEKGEVLTLPKSFCIGGENWKVKPFLLNVPSVSDSCANLRTGYLSAFLKGCGVKSSVVIAGRDTTSGFSAAIRNLCGDNQLQQLGVLRALQERPDLLAKDMAAKFAQEIAAEGCNYDLSRDVQTGDILVKISTPDDSPVLSSVTIRVDRDGACEVKDFSGVRSNDQLAENQEVAARQSALTEQLPGLKALCDKTVETLTRQIDNLVNVDVKTSPKKFSGNVMDGSAVVLTAAVKFVNEQYALLEGLANGTVKMPGRDVPFNYTENLKTNLDNLKARIGDFTQANVFLHNGLVKGFGGTIKTCEEMLQTLDKPGLKSFAPVLKFVAGRLQELWDNLEKGFAFSDTNTDKAANEIITVAQGYAKGIDGILSRIKTILGENAKKAKLSDLSKEFAKLQRLSPPKFTFKTFSEESKVRMLDQLKLISSDLKLKCPSMSPEVAEAIDLFVDTVNIMLDQTAAWPEKQRGDFCKDVADARTTLMTELANANKEGVDLQRGVNSLLSKVFGDLQTKFAKTKSDLRLANLEKTFDEKFAAVSNLYENPKQTGRESWNPAQKQAFTDVFAKLAEVKNAIQNLRTAAEGGKRILPSAEQIEALETQLKTYVAAFLNGKIASRMSVFNLFVRNSADTVDRYVSKEDLQNWENLVAKIGTLKSEEEELDVRNPFAANEGGIKTYDELKCLTKATIALSGTRLSVGSDDLRERAKSILCGMKDCPESFLKTDIDGNIVGLTDKALEVVDQAIAIVVKKETDRLAASIKPDTTVVDISGLLDDEETWKRIDETLEKHFKGEIDTVASVANLVSQAQVAGTDGGLRPGEVLKRGGGVLGFDIASLSAEQKSTLMWILATVFMVESEAQRYEAATAGTLQGETLDQLQDRWLNSLNPTKFNDPTTSIMRGDTGLEQIKQAILTGDIPLDGSISRATLKTIMTLAEYGDKTKPSFGLSNGASLWLGQGFHTSSVSQILRTLRQNGISPDALTNYFLSFHKMAGANGSEKFEDNCASMWGATPVSQHLSTVLGLLFEINGQNGRGLDSLCVRLFGKGILEVSPKDIETFREAHMDLLKEGAVERDFQSLDPAMSLKGSVRTVYDLARGATLINKDNVALAQQFYGGLQSAASSHQNVSLSFGKETVTIVPREDGRFTLEFAGETAMTIPSEASINSVLGRMTDEFLGNPGLAGAKILKAALPPLQAQRMSSRDRQLATNLIAGTTGLQTAVLSEVTTDKLVEIAHAIVDRLSTDQATNRTYAEGLLAKAGGTAQQILFNGADTLELYTRMIEAPKDEVEKSVFVPDTRGARPGETAAEAQLRQIREFVAELVLPANTTKYDIDVTQKGLGEGGVIRQTLLSHRFVVGMLLNRPELADSFVFAGAKGSASQQTAVRDALQKFIVTLRSMMADVGGLPKFYDLLQTGDPQSLAGIDRGLAEIASPLTKAANEMLDDLQGRLTAELNAAFRKTTEGLKNQSIWKKSIDQISGGGTLDVDSGYGRFLMEATASYFSSMKPIDRRRMCSSLLRAVTDKSAQGDLLGAMIKGAGPVFQKLMQGLPQTALPDDLRSAVKDLKSNLPPIPDEMVRATLFDMVRQSNGAIERIELKNSLGAATVGQAFLCTVYTKDNPAGEECVVKILRPDAQNRARREYNHFLKIANETPGMQGAFEARLKGIFDELDFTKEAENVKRGAIYNPGALNDGIVSVRSMELNSDIPPTVNAMVVRKAPGTTYDRYTAEAGKRIDEVVGALHKVVKDGEISYESAHFFTLMQTRMKLKSIYNDIHARQKNLVSFSQKWLYECVFGNGFAHMDVHSGNLMCDKNTLTVIDYGNSAVLSETERKNLKWAMAWLCTRNVGNFLSYFKKLLPEKSLEIFSKAETRKTIEADLGDIFARFNVQDSGRAIAAALHVIEQHGVPLPGQLFGMMQSLQRLDESIRLMNEQLDRVRTIAGQIRFADAPTEEDGKTPSVFQIFQQVANGIGVDGKPFKKRRGFDENMTKLKGLVAKGKRDYEVSGCFSASGTLGHEIGKFFLKDSETNDYRPGSWSAEVKQALADELEDKGSGKLHTMLEELRTAINGLVVWENDQIATTINDQIGSINNYLDNIPPVLNENKNVLDEKLDQIITDTEKLVRALVQSISHILTSDDDEVENELYAPNYTDHADSFSGFGNAIEMGFPSFVMELVGGFGAVAKTVASSLFSSDGAKDLKDAMEERCKTELMQQNRIAALAKEYKNFGKTHNLSDLEMSIVRKQMAEFRYPTGLPARVKAKRLGDEATNAQLVEAILFNVANIENALKAAGLGARFAENTETRPALVKYAMIQVAGVHPELYQGLAGLTAADIDNVAPKTGGGADVKAALMQLAEIGAKKLKDALSQEQLDDVARQFSVKQKLKDFFS